MHIALIHNQYVQKGGMESYLIDLVRGFTEAIAEGHAPAPAGQV
jgi:hypothetical protein